MAKLAIDFVSGPGGIASVLRTSLLTPPFSTRSVPLDVGYSASIPEAIRRAVILRDRHCAWPGGCGKPPAQCGVHHIRHKKDGGPASVRDCILLCQFRQCATRRCCSNPVPDFRMGAGDLRLPAVAAAG